MVWRPDVVVASRMPVATRPEITLAEPAVRPPAVRARIDATRSILRSLAEARQSLLSDMATAEARGEQARSDRERVSAAMATYRLEAELDGVLTGTFRQMTALMEGRGF